MDFHYLFTPRIIVNDCLNFIEISLTIRYISKKTNIRYGTKEGSQTHIAMITCVVLLKSKCSVARFFLCNVCNVNVRTRSTYHATPCEKKILDMYRAQFTVYNKSALVINQSFMLKLADSRFSLISTLFRKPDDRPARFT